METRWVVFVLAFLMTMPAVPCRAQSLADVARQERSKRQIKKAPSKVFTNEDLLQYEASQESPSQQAEATPPESSAPAARPESPSVNGTEERAWSKRFINAKAKLQEVKNQGEALAAKLNDLNLKLMRANPEASQSDVFDREHLYLPLIAQTKEKIEQNKTDTATAEHELEDLRDELRKSGQPASWADSKLALQPQSGPAKTESVKVKDQKYWQEQLAVIDKRYQALTAPLEEERFQLINRRPSAEGESTSPTGQFGMGLPPRVIDIDVQIKELNKKRDQEKAAVVDQAVREGALPGWFR
jgi:hypothetical protein